MGTFGKIFGEVKNVTNSVVTINGRAFYGDNVSITDKGIIIDGKEYKEDSKIINISITGNVDSIDFVNVKSFDMKGNAGSIKTTSGDVSVSGDVSGDVNTVSGDVKAHSITGHVKTVSGDISGARNSR